LINHNSYEVNEAWLVFKINTVPILTQESSINMLALMDIHSGYIFGMITSEDSVSPSKKEVKQLKTTRCAPSFPLCKALCE